MTTKNQMPRTRNTEWGFYGTCRDNGHSDPEAAWNEMMSLLATPDGFFCFKPEHARDLLDCPLGRHIADQLVDGTESHNFRADFGRLLAHRGWAREINKTMKSIIAAAADNGEE